MIPDHITNRDEAYEWMMRHGYSVDVANEELDAWEAGQAPVSVEEVAAVVLEPMIEEDDEELYDVDGEEYDEEEYEFEEDEDEEEEAEDASDD